MRRALDRRIASLAVPALGSLAAEPLYVLADTVIVGHLGTVPLAGLAVASSALTSLAWLVAWLNSITATRVAQARGAGTEARIGVGLRDALVLALLIAAVTGLAVAVLAPSIARLYGPAPEVRRGAVTYLRASAVGIPALVVGFVGVGWLNGMGRTRRTLLVVLVANVVNIALEVVFVYGFHWGLAGSAWGTVIAQWTQVSFLLVLLARAGLLSGWRSVSFAGLRRTVVDGLRFAVRTLAIVGTFAVAVAVASRLGTRQLAAHQIGDKLFGLLALSLDALAVAAQVMVGEAAGAGDVGAIRRITNHLVGRSVIVGVALGGTIAGLSWLLPRPFTDAADVRSTATGVVAILGLLLVPGAIAFLYDGVCLGLSAFGFLQAQALGATMAVVPFVAAVALDHSLGLPVLWFGLTVWMVARAAIQHVWFCRGGWVRLVPEPNGFSA